MAKVAFGRGRMNYSRRHYRLVSPPPDQPGAVEERIQYRKAAAQANEERMQRYPVLTAENFEEAAAFQESRIQELITG